MLYLLSPFINKLINQLNKKEFVKLIIILSLFICVFPSLTLTSLINSEAIAIIYIYILGAFIKRFNFLKDLPKYGCLIIGVMIYIVAIAIDIFFDKYVGFYVSTYTSLYSVFMYGCALFLFEFFRKIQIKEKFGKAILLCSSATFGIYLIHENIFVRNYLWNNLVLKISDYINWHSYLILIYIFIIYIICTIIDIIYNSFISKYFEKLLNKVYLFIKKFINIVKRKVDL